MVREGGLGISQNQVSDQGTTEEEQRMTQALIHIISIATITTLIKVLHYIMRNIFLAKLQSENQELESRFRNLDLKSGENQEDVKSGSFEGYMLNHFDTAMIVTREVGRVFLVINASVNVFITFWSCKRVCEEMVNMVLPMKKILSRNFIKSHQERTEMATFGPRN